jgi:SAM-dependent methyltransferase
MKARKKRKRRPSPFETTPEEAESQEGSGEEPEEKKPAKRSRKGLRCPVCHRSGEPLDATDRARCGTCGAVFPPVRPALGEVAKARDARFARAFSLPNHEEKREAKALAGEAMRGFFAERSGKRAALNAFGKHLLEVNCGLGFRLRAFQSYGWAVAGTETSATAFEYARRQSLDVTHGWLADGRFGKTRFDLVLFCRSFGDMADPRKAVERLRELMAPKGLVCVLNEPLAETETDPPPDATRLLVHTAKSLRKAFCRNGFSFLSEDIDGGAGTFWFNAYTGGSR